MPLFSFDGIVTWIVNPNHFYIQLSTDTDRKCNIEYLIRNLVKNNELKNPGFDLQLDLPYSEFDDTNQDCGQSPFTGKSLSEALLFAEHGENMLCTKIDLNVRNKFFTQYVLPRFHLGIFMY